VQEQVVAGLGVVTWMERSLAAELDHTMRLLSRDGSVFRRCVASGANRECRTRSGERKIRRGSRCLVDWGRGLAGTGSDLTRVFCVDDGRRMREVYKIVLDAQLAAMTRSALPRVCGRSMRWRGQ